MGRRSTDSAAQTKTKTKAYDSGSKTSKPSKGSVSTSGGTPKPPSVGPKKTRAVELDEEEVGGPAEVSPAKRKKVATCLTTMKKSTDDKPKPSTSKEVQSKPKPAKSPLTVVNPGSKSPRKKKKVAPEPVEADSEESEQEWVGFGGVDEESNEGVEEEDDGDSNEEELLHGLSSDDQDSSDEEVELPGIDISKLPTIAKDDKIVKQKLEKAKRQPVRSLTSLIPFMV